jgi:hypothetical protein
MVATPKGLEPENDCASENQKQLQKTDTSSRQRECPISTNMQLTDSNKIMVVSPRWMLYSTDRRS